MKHARCAFSKKNVDFSDLSSISVSANNLKAAVDREARTKPGRGWVLLLPLHLFFILSFLISSPLQPRTPLRYAPLSFVRRWISICIGWCMWQSTISTTKVATEYSCETKLKLIRLVWIFFAYNCKLYILSS
jgi:hypothetical protein